MKYLAIILSVLLVGCSSTVEDPIVELETRGLQRTVGWGNCKPIDNPDPYAPPVLCEGYSGRLFVCPAKVVETVNDGPVDLGKATIEEMMRMYFDRSISPEEYYTAMRDFKHCKLTQNTMIVEIDPVTYNGERRSDRTDAKAYLIKVEDWEGNLYWAGYIISVRQGT